MSSQSNTCEAMPRRLEEQVDAQHLFVARVPKNGSIAQHPFVARFEDFVKFEFCGSRDADAKS
jgi:hypothetical protein